MGEQDPKVEGLKPSINLRARPSERRANQGARPLPALFRIPARLFLRVWSWFTKAPGYHYQIVERWGARLAVRPLACRLSNGPTMICDLTDHIQRQIYFSGAYEPIENYLVRKLLQPEMVMIDAGANVGQYALTGAVEVGPRGQVHAFEPVPKNFERLVDNVQRNGLDEIVRSTKAALWHRAGTTELNLPLEEVGNDGSWTIGEHSGVVETVSSPTVRLDDYINETGVERVDFLKMDVEGSELFALQGAMAVLSRWRPTMLLEINSFACRALGYEPQRIWELLKSFGYLMWAVGQSPETSTSLPSLENVDRANVIFHIGKLPDEVTRGWTHRSVLRFHRRAGRGLAKEKLTRAVN